MLTMYDVLVVGGGHAGCEAACAAARLGVSTLLITMNIDTIALASCNPAIGGLGKGHLVFEIDALGGVMPKAADANAIHSRLLNESKGNAVQGLRSQIDKWRYSSWMRNFVENQENLDLVMGIVDRVLHSSTGTGHKIDGVVLENGVEIRCRNLILTTGTFLNGIIHNGHQSFSGGRAGERSADGLAQSFDAMGITAGRLKTGTPARLHRNTIDWSVLKPQYGDEKPSFFHYATKNFLLPQICCYLTETNERTHEIIRQNLHTSAMYGGKIDSVGPRYCPSIEDKVVRFANRSSHHVFLEPEGLDSAEIYANGLSSSLPPHVQIEFLQSMRGLSKVHLTRFAYAIEYTYVPPYQVSSALESCNVDGLFMAGQINGTTGYEEAAMLGLIAGANAALKVKGKEPLVFNRDEGYIGVLIDDLRTKEHREPYRMFTSRCEHRLLLRQDNSAQRMAEKAHRAGLITQDRFEEVCRFDTLVQNEMTRMRRTMIRKSELVPKTAAQYGLDTLTHGISILSFLSRPDVKYDDLEVLGLNNFEISILEEPKKNRLTDQIELTVKYEPYIERAREFALKVRELDNKRIPRNLDYSQVHSLRYEAVQKLTTLRPETIGQASRIAGVNPTDIQQILIYLKTHSL